MNFKLFSFVLTATLAIFSFAVSAEENVTIIVRHLDESTNQEPML
jgi:hypothetical protein